MAPLNPLDDAAYNEFATNMVYYKLFPLIVNDFLTRADSQQMMLPNNLPVSTTVSTAVQVAVPAGTGTGLGKGTGVATPSYNGNTLTPGSEALKAKYKFLKDTGGNITDRVL